MLRLRGGMHHYSTGAVEFNHVNVVTGDGIRHNCVYLHLNGVLDSLTSGNHTVNLIPFEDMDMVQTEVNVLNSPHSHLLGPAVINNKKSARE